MKAGKPFRLIRDAIDHGITEESLRRLKTGYVDLLQHQEVITDG